MRLSTVIGGMVFWLIITGCTTSHKCVDVRLDQEGEFQVFLPDAATIGFDGGMLTAKGPAVYRSVPVMADAEKNAIMEEACNRLFMRQHIDDAGEGIPIP